MKNSKEREKKIKKEKRKMKKPKKEKNKEKKWEKKEKKDEHFTDSNSRTEFSNPVTLPRNELNYRKS